MRPKSKTSSSHASFGKWFLRFKIPQMHFLVCGQWDSNLQLPAVTAQDLYPLERCAGNEYRFGFWDALQETIVWLRVSVTLVSRNSSYSEARALSMWHNSDTFYWSLLSPSSVCCVIISRWCLSVRFYFVYWSSWWVSPQITMMFRCLKAYVKVICFACLPHMFHICLGCFYLWAAERSM